ncbi:anthranilate synthase component I family protein [Natronoflexus pectinivorans]|uniref:Anthranilate synthase component 1 n=1 Tax=Natronoflexus pectinivorans TaxID=682526 RepID=A0A4R2GN31_9BACT|nr:anthranilate synthase component I family protein [Natronoflexus pectinivorans]TCO10427.1 anthranilate synthase component 1 [Natronoflexus pectinivorans]
MKNYKMNVLCNRIPPHIGDVVTPVSIYLTLRDMFPNTILLESSDYHSNNNSLSFICFDPIADFMVSSNVVTCKFPDGTVEQTALPAKEPLADIIKAFSDRIIADDSKCPVKASGLYGYTTYDSVRYFEDVKLDVDSSVAHAIPDMRYHLYRGVIAFNHFTNQLYLVEHLAEGEESRKDQLLNVLKNRTVPSFRFEPTGTEISPLTDDQYKQMVNKGKEHCFRGDVFQIVLSRQFSQSFKGDEFNVYRALRNINPSPYLFFFDYGDYRLFGSSPESQLVVENNVATINPIAGTFRRTGDDMKDLKLAEELAADPKENAEHVMLVDLARNDLGRNCTDVKVKTYKEIQYYSHVLHLVSEVNGKLKPGSSVPRVMGDTFPAGTLSGAPKFRAMELINKYEPHQRGFYGGCIGKLGLDGSFNQAIAIRSFLSKGNILFYQAGAGVVSESSDVSELNEVNNKLGALKSAIELAKEF